HHTRKLFCLLAGTILLLSNTLFAQPQTQISGKIMDATGNPVSGASVRIKGTNKGTSAAPDGSFSISVPPKAVLVISGVGFEQKEVAVGNNTTLSISLAAGNQNLSEVVVDRKAHV